MHMDVMAMAIQVSVGEDDFRVNGIEIDKKHIASIFPHKTDPDQLIASYLATMPFLAWRHDHFLKYHFMGESAKYALTKAKELYEALGLDEHSMMPFTVVFVERADSDPGELSDALRNAFGECHAESDSTVH